MSFASRGTEAIVVLALHALVAGCYQPRPDPCQLVCGPGGGCPSGLTCTAGYCVAPGSTACALDAAPVDGAVVDASEPDAAPDATDARPPDGAVDATDAGIVTGVTSISAGNRHACAIRSGTLFCWGDNRSSQAGDVATPSTRRYPTPHAVGSANDWVAVAAGQRHSCGLRAGGGVYCWGDGNARQNGGTGTRTSPLPVTGPTGTDLTGATAVCAGGAHSCAIVGAEIVCWGDDFFGQLGNGAPLDGATTAQAVTVVRPAAVPQWTSLACGAAHTCAVGNGGVYCWGASGSNRLGHGSTTTNAPSTAAVSGATAVAAGEAFSCALLGDGTARCWGSYGNLSGVGPTDLGMTGVTGVSAGLFGLCATSGATTRCLGFGGHGDLGTNNFGVSPTLAGAVTGLTGVTAITSGTDFHCALTGAGAWCWGKNSDGQLGRGSVATGFAPRQVPGTWSAVSAGKHTTCGIGPNSRVYCWGDNRDAWAFPSGAGEAIDTTTLINVAPSTTVAVGERHACSVLELGAVWCWGETSYGRVGNNTTGAGVSPHVEVTRTAATITATQVAASDHGSGAISATGANVGLLAWGDNADNRLGLATVAQYGTAQSVDAAATWSSLGFGDRYGCAVQSSLVYCWGRGTSGQLGLGDSLGRVTPTAISSFPVASVAAAAFGDHTCAITSGAVPGQLYCWGDNARRQVNPVPGSPNAPTQFGGDDTWAKVAAGGDTTCAIHSGTGALECWGANDDDSYMVGVDQAPGTVTAPQLLGTSFTSVSLGYSHGCAIKGGTQELWCWGESRYGAAGISGARDFATPQAVLFP